MTGGGPIVMATTLECSQDAILRFLTVRGGRATNRDLLEHFKAVWSDSSDPERRAAVREAFKGYVDAVAFVKKSDVREDGDGVKWVCLRKKYRRSVVKEDEEEASIGTVTADGGTGAAAETEVTVLGGQEEGTGPDDVQKDGSRCENDVVVEIMGSLGTPQQQPCATEARTKEEERTGEESATSGETHHHHHHHHAEVSPAGSGYGNDRQTRRGGETVISRGGGTILVDNRNDQVVDCQQQQPQQQVPVIAVEEDSEEGVAIGEPESDDIMGNALGFKSEKSSSGESVQAASREIPRIAVIEASPLPVAAADGSMFDLPAGLYHHCVCGGAGNDGSTTSEVEQGPASRRRNSTGSQHSLRSGHLSDDDDECHSGGGGSLSGSDNDNGAATPRSASRQNFIELMMNNSPQVRRSMQAHRNSAYLSRCNDGDSSSVASSSLAGDEYRAAVALDPLEHAWMMCASDGEWAGLAALLADEPALLLRRDFVTGFTCLHWAAKLGRAELLALVVNFARRHQVAVDVDVRSGAGGYTPLHLAAMHGHVDVLKLLVGAYGADVEVRDYSGRKACQYLTDNNATIDLREIIAGASAERDSDTAADGAGGAAGGARRRLSNALVDVLNPLRLLHHHHNDDGDDEATDGQSSKRRDKPVRRKSSLSGRMRPKLQRLRDRTSQIVHSVSFHDAEDLRATRSERRGGSFRSSRPKSNLFG